MDSSNNSCNYSNLSNFLENDINNPTPKLDDPANSYSLFNFPNSPHYSNMGYESLYLHQIYHHLLSDPTNTQNNPPEENPIKTAPRSVRSSKKDRHSKINTARGPRDRRMRLSLDVARKFFDLQDMLGYDKASRTVDWLLKNSSLAISDIERGRNMGANYGSSNHSECDQEVVSSGLDNLSGVWENGSGGKNEERSSAKQIKKKVKKVVHRAIVEKESRKKARERARVRASQKRRPLSGTADDQRKPCAESNDNHNYEQSLMVKSRERDEIFYNYSMSFEVPWNYPSTALNPHDNGISHPHHLAEVQFCGKPWEAQNSCN